MATSLGESIDYLITSGSFNPSSGLGRIYSEENGGGIPNSSVTATVSNSGGNYVVTVQAKVAKAEYVYTAVYKKSGASYVRQA